VTPPPGLPWWWFPAVLVHLAGAVVFGWHLVAGPDRWIAALGLVAVWISALALVHRALDP
jgi:hypothetical protein